MKYDIIEIPAEPQVEGMDPAVTGLQVQNDGSLLCGLSFSKPLLFKVVLGAAGLAPSFENLKVESFVPDGFSILNGLRGTTTGDTAFLVLQDGMLPGWLKRLMGSEWRGKRGAELAQFLYLQEGGIGAHVRHSVLQIVEGKLRLRHSKMPGALLDVAHIGDFIFGISESGFWREPYLKPEKREYVRNDLEANHAIHRDGDGNFWLRGEAGRLLRAGQTDIKATPTTLKLKGEGFMASAESHVDGFCYGVTQDGKNVFRVRRNRVSKEHEIQPIGGDFDGEVTALAVIEHAERPFVLIAESGTGEGLVLHRLDIERLGEDAEDLPTVGNLTRIGALREISSTSTLAVDGRDSARPVVYVGEGRLEKGATGGRPKLAIVTDLVG